MPWIRTADGRTVELHPGVEVSALDPKDGLYHPGTVARYVVLMTTG